MLKRNTSQKTNKPHKSYGTCLAEREFSTPKITKRRFAAHVAVNQKFINDSLFAYPGQHD